MCFFFFQAEDGIRDLTVTGVQTCALPICRKIPVRNPASGEVIGHVAHADVADLDRALAAAQRGFEVWRNVSRSEEHTSELQSQSNLVCRLLLEKKKNAHLY